MNAAEYISKNKVNCELILWTSDTGILHYGVRLRPWKQDSLTPKMILCQGVTLEDAIRVAARELYKAAWQKLDYALRPWIGPLPVQHQDDDPSQFDFLGPEMAPVPLFGAVVNDAKGALKKMSQHTA